MPATSITDLNANFFPHLSERIRIFETYSKGLMRNALRLFVAVSGLLDTKHHMQLSSVLWRQCLDGNNLEVQASVRIRSGFIVDFPLNLRTILPGDVSYHAECRKKFQRLPSPNSR